MTENNIAENIHTAPIQLGYFDECKVRGVDRAYIFVGPVWDRNRIRSIGNTKCWKIHIRFDYSDFRGRNCCCCKCYT
jgi:hypothetical protein